jgi:hypothetical protein
VVLAEEQDSKQYVRDHLWFNKYAEIAMELVQLLEIHVLPAEGRDRFTRASKKR